MRQCEWCGLITEDEKVCSWCGHVNEAAFAPPHESKPEEQKKRRRLLIGATAVAAVAAILISVKAAPAVEAEGDTMVTQAQMSRPRVVENRRAGPVIDVAEFPKPERQYANRVTGGYLPEEEPVQEEIEAAEDPLEMLPMQGYGSVTLAGAQIASQLDENGNAMIGGVVGIVNDGDYAITDVRLTLNVGGVAYPLTLMEPVGRIEPGEEIAVPIMASGAFAEGIPTVTLQATVDGPPGVITDATYAVPF